MQPRKRRASKAKLGPKIELFADFCEKHGLPRPIAEYKFATKIGREWAFDWAWPDAESYCPNGCTNLAPVALEVDGIWCGGKHNRGSGIKDDQEKRNNGVCMGWKVLVCTPQEIQSGSIIELLKRVL